MGTCLDVLPDAEPWAAVVIPDACRVGATFFHGCGPAPSGISEAEMDAAQRAHAAAERPGGAYPVVWMELPREDAGRLLLVLDQVLDHAAYQRWAKTGGTAGSGFAVDVVAGGQRVLVTGPMQTAVGDYTEDLDEGEPPYTHAYAVVGFDVLADLRRVLAEAA
jgi:hypothetical protein